MALENTWLFEFIFILIVVMSFPKFYFRILPPNHLTGTIEEGDFEPIDADIALIRAHRADELGNLAYYKTACNFNPLNTLKEVTQANFKVSDRLIPMTGSV